MAMSATADNSGASEVLQTSALPDVGEPSTTVRDAGAATAPSPRRLYVVPRPSRPCGYCGELMENPRADQRFCRNPRHRRPHLARPAARPCGFCGEMIEKPRRGQKFCRKPRRCASNARLSREYARADERRRLIAPAIAAIQVVEEARAVARLQELGELAPARIASAHETAPMIGILIESMPAPGSSWPRAARAQWTAVLERTLDALYPGGR